jgi:hypothetical protein
MARVTPRALARAGNSIQKFARQAAHSYQRDRVLEALDPNVKAANDAEAKRLAGEGGDIISNEELTLTYGPASDDTVANIYESVVQGGSAILALSPVLPGAIGATVAGTMAFDLREKQLAEAAAEFGDRIPGIGGVVKEAGKFLSVDEQDGFISAWIKRTVVDGLTAAGFEGIFWGIKALSARMAGDTAAELAARAKVQQVVDGTRAPTDAEHVVVVPEKNGTWAHKENPAKQPKFVGIEERPNVPVDGKGAFDEPPAGTVFDPETYTPVEHFSEGSSKATYNLPGTADQAYVMYHVNAEGELRIGFIGATSGENSLGTGVTRRILKDLAERTGAKKISGYRISGAGAGREVEHVIPNGKPAVEPNGKPAVERRVADVPVTTERRGVTTAGDDHPVALSEDRIRDSQKLLDADKALDESGGSIGKAADALAAKKRPPDVTPEEVLQPQPSGPRFESRAEAEAQAHSINEALNGRSRAQSPILFTPEETAAHVQLGLEIAAAKTGKDAARLITNAHFNFNWLGGTARVKAQIAALTETISKQIDAAQAGVGKTSHKVVAKAAQRTAETIGMRDWAERIAGMAAERSQGHVELLMANAAVKQLGGDMAKLSGKIRLRPQDPVLMAQARELLELWAPMTRDVAGLNSQAGRDLEILLARNTPEAEAIRFPKESNPARAEAQAKAGTNGNGKAPKVEPPKSAPIFDKLSDEEIKTALRMFELADGRVRNAQAIIDGLKVLDRGAGPVGKVIEAATKVYINALISGPKTMLTIFTSGQTLLHFEYLTRMLAGAPHAAFSGNTKLFREGAQMLYGHYRYAIDNIKGAGAAFRENRSVIDPSPQLYATGGIIDKGVILPGRSAGTLDEFTRVTGYRAFVRAKSARLATEEGLTGAAWAKRVEDDVRMSVDEKTGVGIMENALDFAGIPTLSNHPGAGTFSGDLVNFLAKYPATKWIAPFVRPGVNTFTYVGKATPGLNFFYKDMRATLLGKNGSEEAAIAWTRSALAGALYTYAWFKVTDGTITGRGPTNPTLRNEWLSKHKPYSVLVPGDEEGQPLYKSFRRMEPFASFLGLMADAHMVQLEMADDEGVDADDVGKAVFGSLLNNIVNKTYNQGLADFFGAVDDQDGSSIDNWLGGIAGGYVPQIYQQLGGLIPGNDDPYYREARGFVDELMKRTPGLSDKLPPKYNFLGEPIMKSGSFYNRNISIAPTLEAGPSIVEDALLQDGIKLSPPPDKEFDKQIDFKDERWKKSEDDKLPYVRWMELLSEGFDGEPGLRKRMEAMIQSDEWTDATSGSLSWQGGERGIIAARIKSVAERQAKMRMMEEYPELFEAWKGAAGMRGTSRGEGQAGVDARRNEFGVPIPRR